MQTLFYFTHSRRALLLHRRAMARIKPVDPALLALFSALVVLAILLLGGAK